MFKSTKVIRSICLDKGSFLAREDGKVYTVKSNNSKNLHLKSAWQVKFEPLIKPEMFDAMLEASHSGCEFEISWYKTCIIELVEEQA